MRFIGHPEEGGLAERGTRALLLGLVITTFLMLAIGSSLYDVGDWLGMW
jgi:hypothetical protein